MKILYHYCILATQIIKKFLCDMVDVILCLEYESGVKMYVPNFFPKKLKFLSKYFWITVERKYNRVFIFSTLNWSDFDTFLKIAVSAEVLYLGPLFSMYSKSKHYVLVYILIRYYTVLKKVSKSPRLPKSPQLTIQSKMDWLQHQVFWEFLIV